MTSGSPEVPGADVARASAPYRGGTPSCSKLLEDVWRRWGPSRWLCIHRRPWLLLRRSGVKTYVKIKDCEKKINLSINSFETCFTDSFFLLAGDKLKTVDSCCFWTAERQVLRSSQGPSWTASSVPESGDQPARWPDDMAPAPFGPHLGGTVTERCWTCQDERSTSGYFDVFWQPISVCIFPYFSCVEISFHQAGVMGMWCTHVFTYSLPTSRRVMQTVNFLGSNIIPNASQVCLECVDPT